MTVYLQQVKQLKNTITMEWVRLKDIQVKNVKIKVFKKGIERFFEFEYNNQEFEYWVNSFKVFGSKDGGITRVNNISQARLWIKEFVENLIYDNEN